MWLANGGRALLFDLTDDPHELHPLQDDRPAVVRRLMALLVAELRREQVVDAFDGDRLRTHPYQTWPLRRIRQFDRSRGITGFPADPAEVVDARR